MTIPATMTAIEASAPGGPEVLRPTILPVPRPAPGEVLIRVAAAGVNAPDLAQRRGSYAPPPGASPLPGLEVSGVIVATGGETPYSGGEPVVALTNGGGYAEYVTVPAGQVLPLPRGWSLCAGGALPETYFTIEQTLVLRAGLGAGMNVLIHGAAGGIGGAAIGACVALGARAIAVVSSAAKAAYVRSIGADAVIVHTSEDFVARVKELTGGKGADRVVDVVGGETLARSIDAAARGGHIVLVGSLGGSAVTLSAGKIVARWLTLSGSTLRPQSAATKAAIAEGLRRDLWPALGEGRIRPPRIRALPLEQASRAHAEIEKREHFGKLILLTDYGRSLADADNSIELA